jgi:hypothetical protein
LQARFFVSFARQLANLWDFSVGFL